MPDRSHRSQSVRHTLSGGNAKLAVFVQAGDSNKTVGFLRQCQDAAEVGVPQKGGGGNNAQRSARELKGMICVSRFRGNGTMATLF